MIIAVNHKINNPEKFWASAQDSLPKLPEGNVHRVLQVLPNPTMTEAVCIWEADSIDDLNTYLRERVTDWSSETYQEVNLTNAMGLQL